MTTPKNVNSDDTASPQSRTSSDYYEYNPTSVSAPLTQENIQGALYTYTVTENTDTTRMEENT